MFQARHVTLVIEITVSEFIEILLTKINYLYQIKVKKRREETSLLQ